MVWVSPPPPPYAAENLAYSGVIRSFKPLSSCFSLLRKALSDKARVKTLKDGEVYRSIQTGRSMLEMLGVLAIIGILSIASLTGLQWALAKYKAFG